MITELKSQSDNHREMMLEATISYMMVHLGVRYHTKGYAYIKYAIKLVYDDPDYYIGFTTKRLYPDIGKKFGIPGSRIERSIRYAIDGIVCTDEVKKEVFGYVVDGYTNTEFIVGIVECIRRMEQSYMRG